MENNTTRDDNKLTKFVIFIVLITMIAMVLVSGTYAKYTSTATGSDTATVAKWSFTVNDKEIAVDGYTETITFGLFDTINDSDGTNAEGDVVDTKIAPGTSGSFDLILKNTADVTAQYGIDFEVTNTNNIPIQYSIDGGTTWTTTLNSISPSDDTKLAIGSSAKTVTVDWKWEFETEAGDGTVTAGDTADTTLGILARDAASETDIPSITVEATVNAAQCD